LAQKRLWRVVMESGYGEWLWRVVIVDY
jgi:hypothetical protein